MTLAVEISVRVRHHARRWRDGRAVECTGLENQQGVTAFQGSNPCPSAIFQYKSIIYEVFGKLADIFTHTALQFFLNTTNYSLAIFLPPPADLHAQ